MTQINKKRKNKKEKHPKWKNLLYIVATVLAFLLMWSGAYLTEIEGKSFEYIAISLFGFICEIFIALLIANLETQRGIEEYTGIPDDLLKFGKMIVTAFKYKLFVRIGAFMCASFVIGGILGCLGVVDICDDVTYAIINHESFEPLLEKGTEDENNNEYVEMPELSSEDEEWFEKQDPEMVSKVEGLKISIYELELIRTLSSNDAGWIFFLDGKYKIDNWENETEILEKVRLFIDDYYEIKKENMFDGFTSQDLQDEVSDISEAEIIITLFSDRKENMERRQDIYSTFPKAKLALLISNDEHTLALALFRNDGNENSILYYYAKAIEYRMERITFKEVSKDSLKSDIEWIGARYADIVYTCPNSKYRVYAEKLRDAFNEVAKEY